MTGDKHGSTPSPGKPSYNNILTDTNTLPVPLSNSPSQAPNSASSSTVAPQAVAEGTESSQEENINDELILSEVPTLGELHFESSTPPTSRMDTPEAVIKTPKDNRGAKLIERQEGEKVTPNPEGQPLPTLASLPQNEELISQAPLVPVFPYIKDQAKPQNPVSPVQYQPIPKPYKKAAFLDWDPTTVEKLLTPIPHKVLTMAKDMQETPQSKARPVPTKSLQIMLDMRNKDQVKPAPRQIPGNQYSAKPSKPEETSSKATQQGTSYPAKPLRNDKQTNSMLGNIKKREIENVIEVEKEIFRKRQIGMVMVESEEEIFAVTSDDEKEKEESKNGKEFVEKVLNKRRY